jgi:endonuclease/exonuclease/phosphatase (EEP) superfamily protein YafD
MPRIAAALERCMRWLCIGGLIAWVAGQACRDAWSWSQWLFWIPPFAVSLGALGSLAVTAAVGGAGWRRRAVPAAVALLWTASAGTVRFVGFGPAHASDARSVSLLQWNTDWPSGDEPRSMSFLAANPADIVVISNRGAITSIERVHAWAGADATVAGAGPFALVTRMPVLQARQVAVGGKGRQLWWVGEFEVAPPSWNGRTLRIAAVDLPSRPSIAKSQIAEGLRAACEDGGLGEVDVVVGDFNTVDRSVIIERCFPGFRDALAGAGRGWLATWPRAFPLWKIDHVLLGAGIGAGAARTLDPGASHHRATRVELVPEAR